MSAGGVESMEALQYLNAAGNSLARSSLHAPHFLSIDLHRFYQFYCSGTTSRKAAATKYYSV